MRCARARKLILLRDQSESPWPQEHNSSRLLLHIRQCAGCRSYFNELREAELLPLSLVEAPAFDEEFFLKMRSDVLREITRDLGGSSFSSFIHLASSRPALIVLLMTLLFAGTAYKYFYQRDEEIKPVVGRESERLVLQSGEGSGSTSASISGNDVQVERKGPEIISDGSPKIAVRTSSRNAQASRLHSSQRAANKFGKEYRIEVKPGVAQGVEITPLTVDATASANAPPPPPPLRIELATPDPKVRIIWFTPLAKIK